MESSHITIKNNAKKEFKIPHKMLTTDGQQWHYLANGGNNAVYINKDKTHVLKIAYAGPNELNAAKRVVRLSNILTPADKDIKKADFLYVILNAVKNTTILVPVFPYFVSLTANPSHEIILNATFKIQRTTGRVILDAFIDGNFLHTEKGIQCVDQEFALLLTGNNLGISLTSLTIWKNHHRNLYNYLKVIVHQNNLSFIFRFFVPAQFAMVLFGLSLKNIDVFQESPIEGLYIFNALAFLFFHENFKLPINEILQEALTEKSLSHIATLNEKINILQIKFPSITENEAHLIRLAPACSYIETLLHLNIPQELRKLILECSITEKHLTAIADFVLTKKYTEKALYENCKSIFKSISNYNSNGMRLYALRLLIDQYDFDVLTAHTMLHGLPSSIAKLLAEGCKYGLTREILNNFTQCEISDHHSEKMINVLELVHLLSLHADHTLFEDRINFSIFCIENILQQSIEKLIEWHKILLLFYFEISNKEEKEITEDEKNSLLAFSAVNTTDDSIIENTFSLFNKSTAMITPSNLYEKHFRPL